MYRILFNIGSFSIYSYGVMLALAFIIGIFLAMQEAKKNGENPERILDLSLYIILGTLIGGRLGYILLYFGYYLKNPVKILYFRQGGLSFFGGFFIAYILCWWYIKISKISFWKYADIIAPSIAIGLAIGRIGCFLNGCCYGLVSEKYGLKFPALNMPPVYLQQLKDGLIAPGSPSSLPVIPTQLYSSIYNFIIFFILLLWIKKHKKYNGYVFLSFLILYSICRFIIEFFRFYEINKILNFITITQIICLAVILYSLICMNILKKRK